MKNIWNGFCKYIDKVLTAIFVPSASFTCIDVAIIRSEECKKNMKRYEDYVRSVEASYQTLLKQSNSYKDNGWNTALNTADKLDKLTEDYKQLKEKHNQLKKKYYFMKKNLKKKKTN